MSGIFYLLRITFPRGPVWICDATKLYWVLYPIVYLPRPPHLIGRVASRCCKGPKSGSLPVMSCRRYWSRWVSKWCVACCMTCGFAVCIVKYSLDTSVQLRNYNNSLWGSCILLTESINLMVFCTMSMIKSLQYFASKLTGHPRSLTPNVVLLILLGKEPFVKLLEYGVGKNSFILLTLRCSPLCFPSLWIICRALETYNVSPTIVPSSKYQEWRSSVQREAIFWTSGCSAREKSNGPSGSPCCTPWAEDKVVLL